MIAPDVVRTFPGYFMTTLRYVPLDLSCAAPELADAVTRKLSSAVQQFGTGWTLWFECQRNWSVDFDAGEWPNAATRLFDAQRAEQFRKGGQLKSEYFVTLLYRPAAGFLGEIEARLESTDDDATDPFKIEDKDRAKFEAGVSAFKGMLAGAMVEVTPLSGDALVTYLHSTVSAKRHPVRYTGPRLHMNWLLDSVFVPGASPMLGDHHLGLIKIMDTPDISNAGMLDFLNYLPYPYRRVVRYKPRSQSDAIAEIEFIRKSYDIKTLSPIQRLVRWFKPNYEPSTVRHDQVLLRDEAEKARTLVQLGKVSFGSWDHYVVLMDRDLGALQERVDDVTTKINSIGFPTYVATDDSHAAWFSTVPGHPAGDRRNLDVSSLSMACVLPATAVWTGPAQDNHLKAPVLRRCIDSTGTHFNLSLHPDGSYCDVGHVVAVGPTGAGKSTLLNSYAGAFLRYPDWRVAIIDVGGSARCTTLSVGGEYLALAEDDTSVKLQPFARANEASERAWALPFLKGCLADRIEITPEREDALTRAVTTLGSAPRPARTFTTLYELLQDEGLRAAMAIFCRGGELGDLFDNSEGQISAGSRFLCFETAELRKRPQAVGPALACVFHEIDRGIDGSPYLIIFDEAWKAMTHPFLASQILELLKTGRKRNVSVMLATQEVADITAASPALVQSVLNSCPTRLFTANMYAEQEDTKEALRWFGLKDEEVAKVTDMAGKREYFFKIGNLSRKIDLALTPVEIAVFGSNSPADHKAMDRILREHGRTGFIWNWLIHKGFDAKQVHEWSQQYGDEYLMAAE